MQKEKEDKELMKTKTIEEIKKIHQRIKILRAILFKLL
jgi:hypothetical protein